MTTLTALFYTFATVLLFAAFRVVTARSTVHAVLFLVLAFFSASCIWMLLAAEFLAIALVLVYVGAVMVLFLFVVMMLDINADSFEQIRADLSGHRGGLTEFASRGCSPVQRAKHPLIGTFGVGLPVRLDSTLSP